jgi:hypothetical protein
VWLATFVVLTALARYFGDDEPGTTPQPRRERKSSTPVL